MQTKGCSNSLVYSFELASFNHTLVISHIFLLLIGISLRMEGCSMSNAYTNRLIADFNRLKDDVPVGVSGTMQEGNVMVWNAIILSTHIRVFVICVIKY